MSEPDAHAPSDKSAGFPDGNGGDGEVAADTGAVVSAEEPGAENSAIQQEGAPNAEANAARETEEPDADKLAAAKAERAKLRATRTFALVKLSEEFAKQQRTILATAEFFKERQHELDDFKQRVVADLMVRYPELGQDRLRAALDVFYAGGERSQDSIRDRMDKMMELVGDKYARGTFFHDLSRATVQAPTLSRTFESLLTALVSDFEVLVAQLVLLHLRTDVRVLGDGERTFSWKDVVDSSSIEAFTETVIERTVDDLMRKSADDWFAFMASKFKLTLPGVLSSKELKEVFQRRHVVVHAGGVASRAYAAKLKSKEAKEAVGKRLEVDHDYLVRAADLLAEAALGLACNSAKRICEPDMLARGQNQLANLPYRFLQEGRYVAAAAICGMYVTARFEEDETRLVMQVNYWLAHKLAGTFDSARTEVKAWQAEALRPKYRLAKLALLDDLPAALTLAKSIQGTEDLPHHHWLTWPLLAPVRDHERTLAAEGSQAADEALTSVVSEPVASTDTIEESDS